MCPAECADNSQLLLIFLLGELNYLEHLDLVFCVEPISGLNLETSSTETANPGQVPIQISSQILHTGLGHRLGSVLDPQPSIGDIHVGHAIELHRILLGPVPRKQGMGVRIHEPGQHAKLAAVDHLLKLLLLVWGL